MGWRRTAWQPVPGHFYLTCQISPYESTRYEDQAEMLTVTGATRTVLNPRIEKVPGTDFETLVENKRLSLKPFAGHAPLALSPRAVWLFWLVLACLLAPIVTKLPRKSRGMTYSKGSLLDSCEFVANRGKKWTLIELA